MDLRDLTVYFPVIFSDKGWKKLEKRIGVSSTGIGASLRKLEKSAIKVDAAMNAAVASGDSAPARAAWKAHMAAIAGVRSSIEFTELKLDVKDHAAKSWMTDYLRAIKQYQAMWRQDFKPRKPQDLDVRIRSFHLDNEVTFGALI